MSNNIILLYNSLKRVNNFAEILSHPRYAGLRENINNMSDKAVLGLVAHIKSQNINSMHDVLEIINNLED